LIRLEFVHGSSWIICGKRAAIPPKDRRICRRICMWGLKGSDKAMKLFVWVVSAGLVASSVVLASAANAQGAAPNGGDQARLSKVSDVDGPYTGAPPPPPAPPMPPMPPHPYGYGYGQDSGHGYAPQYGYGGGPDRGYGPQYGYGPRGPDYGYGPPPNGYGYGASLLPLPEVYAVLRENGFSPLGVPYQRGMTYVIAVIDRGGEDGRLVIDARNGRIIRFVPASRWGEAYDRMGYEIDYPPPGPMPPPIVIRGIPRPPAPIPHVSRTVPVPTPKPTVAGKPADASQQSAAVETKPPAPQATTQPQPNVTVGEVKPVPQAPQILPTQKMPAVQPLE
jgi:hypothetical protein